MENREPVESVLVDRVAAVQNLNLPSRLSRSWNVFKYYRKSQLALRASSLVGKRLGVDSQSRTAKSLSVAAESRDVRVRDQSSFKSVGQIHIANAYRNSNEIRKLLSAGEISVLNSQRPVQWRIHEPADGPDRRQRPIMTKSLLWQFQLHYHEYLLPLAGDPTSPDNERLIEQTIDSWIRENTITDNDAHVDAWHPYCISRRLPIWFYLLSLGNFDDSFRSRMTASAHLQAEFLSKNLEWELRGNHLLENLRAIALAGCFFDSKQSQGWLALVRKILPLQIKEQVLASGEHFERCPMYHCQVLGNFLEMLLVSQSVDDHLHNLIRPVAARMLDFLSAIIHPDGEIPLLGDSCFGEAPNVSCLRSLAQAATLNFDDSRPGSSDNVITVGDYWTFRTQDDYLIFDRGPAGADFLPAHAHCDLLTLESSIGGVRWLVDSGLFGYDDDPMRWYCRSSLAHNVVCVDDQNQFDIWSKFRMGSRGWPSGWSNGQENGFVWATASHNSYRELGIKKLARLVGIMANRFWYCLDRVESIPPPSRRLTGFMHLSPDVQVATIDDFRFEILLGKTRHELSFHGVKSVNIIESWYCPEFGLRLKNLVLEYEFEPAANVAGWLLKPKITPRNIEENERLKIDSERCDGLDQIRISTFTDQIVHTFNWKNCK